MNKLKIYTANFYQVRNLKPNMIPFSTAKGEPSWYHDNKDRNHVFVDKRNVINGLVAEPFQFDETLVNGEIECSRNCELKPFQCNFMIAYRKSIEKYSFDYIIDYLKEKCESMREVNKFKGEPIVILLVYEHPSCICAERPVIHQYFYDHGYIINEWNTDIEDKVNLF